MHKSFKYILLLFIFAFSCLIQIVGCGGTDSATDVNSTINPVNLDYGQIQGTVSASGATVLSNAIVETYQVQTTTASNGTYLLGPIPAGDYRVIARYGGYAPSVKDKVRVYSGKITENVDFALTQSAASYSVDFAVLSLVPRLGTDRDVISVFCKGCGKEQGKVFFNGKEASIISWNDNNDDKIVVQAPENVETGPVTVEIKGEKSHETQEVIFVGKPVILSAVPSIAKGNQKIRLNGRNFNSIAGFNKVKLSGKDCQVISVASSTSMDILLPQNAQTGLISIRIESNEYQLDGISEVIETIQPEIIYLSPMRSVAGVPLTVYGYNFGTDKNIVRVLFGSHVILPTEFISFSDTKLSFTVPDNTILPAGDKADIRVKVNQSQSNALTYTAYNTVNNTLTNYGIYDFNAVSSGGTLHLATLKPTDRIAFLSVMSGDGTQSLDGDYSYIVTSFLGGNFNKVPNLPANIRASSKATQYSFEANNIEPPLRFLRKEQTLRASLGNPASSAIEVFLRDFKSSNPWDPTNDILATGTLIATTSHALVYFDIKITGLTDTDAQAIGNIFDNVYEAIATACWDGLSSPPEGNIDTQPKVAIFVSPTLNETVSNEVVTSYFDERDKNISQTNSAGTEILYANSETYAADTDEFKASLAASLQSMMYFNQKSLERTDWQNIALRTFARQEIGFGFKQDYARAVNWVEDYLTHSPYASLTHWPTTPSYYNYGLEYLFIQYLFDRCKEYNTIRVLEKQNGAIGVVDINANIIGAGLADPPAASFKELFHDFCKALYCDHLGLPDGLAGYDKNKLQFKSIQLRGKLARIDGLRGNSYFEDAVHNRLLSTKGYGCSMFEYSHGNWGDLEVNITATPTDGDFKTWVIFYSTQ